MFKICNLSHDGRFDVITGPGQGSFTHKGQFDLRPSTDGAGLHRFVTVRECTGARRTVLVFDVHGMSDAAVTDLILDSVAPARVACD